MKLMLLMPSSTGIYGRPSSPPVGMACLMSYLRSKGHEARVLDLRVEKPGFDYLRAIRKFGPQLVGVSFTSTHYHKSYELIRLIKQETGLPLVIGGPHASVLRARILEECAADYAIYGEGERALENLASGKNPAEIKSLIWKDNGRIMINQQEDFIADLDSLPFPEYELFTLAKYADKRIPISTSRGCPHICVYCAVDLIIGRRFRTRSPKNVADEIEHWYKKGYRNFGFNDDTFTENVRRAEEICDEIISRSIKIRWDLRTGIRVDRINKNLLEKLKKAGCYFIAFGIESYDSFVLKKIRKGTTPRQALEAIRLTKETGIGTGGFFMIGNPGDTYEKFRKTYEFARQPFFNEVRFYNVEPYPGTQLYEWIGRNGRFLIPMEKALNSYSRWSQEPVFETDDFPRKERIKAFNEGEFLVASKLLNKVLGVRLGLIAAALCHVKFIRRLMLLFGFKSAGVIFRVLRLKRS